MLYPSAKAIIYDPANPSEFLMVRRHGYYEPAGGKLHVNFANKKAETFEECATREALEELGAIIEIEDYLGSFYFFWTIAPNSFSACIVYSSRLIQTDKMFIKNKDCAELPLNPTWVHAQDIINDNVPINPHFIGLTSIMKKFAQAKLVQLGHAASSLQ